MSAALDRTLALPDWAFCECGDSGCCVCGDPDLADADPARRVEIDRERQRQRETRDE